MTMTNDITAEEYRTAQRVLASDRTRGDLAGIAVWCGQRAAAIDAAQARDTEAEQLAPVLYVADYNADVNWADCGEIGRDDYRRMARAALDHLASRLAPDNGITLTADEAADVRMLLEHAVHLGHPRAVAIRERLSARFAPTEQAESQSPTGFDVRCTKRPDPRTARSWPSLDQVPHDVTVTDNGGERWEFRDGKWRWLWERKRGDQWMVHTQYPAPAHLAPFVEVVGGVPVTPLEVLAAHRAWPWGESADDVRCHCGLTFAEADHPAHVLDALTKAGHEVVQAVSTEERWVPVTESGKRWEPRSREAAEEAMQDWPAGGVYESVVPPYDGITHIVHERRVATDWEPVAAAAAETGGKA